MLKNHQLKNQPVETPFLTGLGPIFQSLTLNGSLGAHGGGQTERAGHEVGEDLVGARGLLGGIFAEVGDLQSRRVLLGGAEGALEGGLGGLGDSPPLLAGGDGGAGGRGELLAGAGAQQRAGSGRERHGERSNCSRPIARSGRVVVGGREGGEENTGCDGEDFRPEWRLEVEVGGPASPQFSLSHKRSESAAF